MNLLGRRIDEVREDLKSNGIDFILTYYYGQSPYKDADCERIVRVKKENTKLLNLTICFFKSMPNC